MEPNEVYGKRAYQLLKELASAEPGQLTRFNVLSFLGDFFESLLEKLSDPSDKVVLLVLDVHACIAQDHALFHELVVHLVKNFKKDNSLLENVWASQARSHY